MTLDEFKGPFAITDHSLIPGSLLNYLGERFYNAPRLSRVPLDDINSALNEVWQGVGSMERVREATRELRRARTQNQIQTVSTDPVQTIDDFTASDFEYSHTDVGSEED